MKKKYGQKRKFSADLKNSVTWKLFWEMQDLSHGLFLSNSIGKEKLEL